jgi:hypothetical protein
VSTFPNVTDEGDAKGGAGAAWPNAGTAAKAAAGPDWSADALELACDLVGFNEAVNAAQPARLSNPISRRPGRNKNSKEVRSANLTFVCSQACERVRM